MQCPTGLNTLSRLAVSRETKPANLPGSASLLHQIIPGAFQGGFDPLGRGDEDVDFPGLDPLDVADIEVHLFGQLFLGDFARELKAGVKWTCAHDFQPETTGSKTDG
jgi:hypothetical protein